MLVTSFALLLEEPTEKVFADVVVFLAGELNEGSDLIGDPLTAFESRSNLRANGAPAMLTSVP
jgi:hypothetical protein